MAKHARGAVISKSLQDGVSKSLRLLTKTWMGTDKDDPQEQGGPSGDAPAPHSFSHVDNQGEMNHMGQYLCDHCDGEMKVVTFHLYKTPPPGVPDLKIPIGEDFRWQCSRCGRKDDTSFRVCTHCGKKTVSDKWAASARHLPVSLNAGGCTDCQRCVLCDGMLAIGNLMWFHGRWTHTYPSPEYDRQTGEQIMVTRERSSTYAFHAHQSCHQKNTQAIVQLILQRTPEWYKQGDAEQQRTDAERLRSEGRCVKCKNPLSFWDRMMERATHKGCV